MFGFFKKKPSQEEANAQRIASAVPVFLSKAAVVAKLTEESRSLNSDAAEYSGIDEDWAHSLMERAATCGRVAKLAKEMAGDNVETRTIKNGNGYDVSFVTTQNGAEYIPISLGQ